MLRSFKKGCFQRQSQRRGTPTGKLIAISRGSGYSRSAISDDPKKTITFLYDSYGRLIERNDPDKGTVRMHYNAEGLPDCAVQADGTTLCRRYDAAGRPVELREGSLDGKLLARYKYSETESAFGGGRLTSVQDDAGHRRYHYDPITGKVARLERKYTAEGRVQNFDTVNTYGPGGVLLTREFSATGLRLMYRYYSDGNLREIALYDPEGRVVQEGNGTVLANFGMPDANGNVSKIEYANGVQLEIGYNPRTGRPTSRRARSVQGGLLLDEALSYTNEGYLKAIQDRLQADGVDLSQSFVYDTAHRLLQARGPYGEDRTKPTKTLRYRYAEDGQPLFFGGRVVRYTKDSKRTEASGGIRYLFDNEARPGQARGNVIRRTNEKGEAWSFTYNYQNRVASVDKYGVDGQSRIDFVYDSGGRVFRKRTRDPQGAETSLYQVAPDYRIFVDGGDETHTLSIYGRQGQIAQLGFSARVHLAGGPGFMKYREEVAQSMQRLWYGDGSMLANLGNLASGGLLFVWSHPRRNGALYDALALLLIGIALVWLFMLWKQYDFRGRLYAYYPPTAAVRQRNYILRFTSLLLIVTFNMTMNACVGASNASNQGVIPVVGTLGAPYTGPSGSSELTAPCHPWRSSSRDFRVPLANIDGLVGNQ